MLRIDDFDDQREPKQGTVGRELVRVIAPMPVGVRAGRIEEDVDEWIGLFRSRKKSGRYVVVASTTNRGRVFVIPPELMDRFKPRSCECGSLEEVRAWVADSCVFDGSLRDDFLDALVGVQELDTRPWWRFW